MTILMTQLRNLKISAVDLKTTPFLSISIKKYLNLVKMSLEMALEERLKIVSIKKRQTAH
jgi:hypothetical protein